MSTTKLAEPVAHIVILPTKDAGPTKFFTSPSDPRGFPVYAAPAAPAPATELSDDELDALIPQWRHTTAAANEVCWQRRDVRQAMRAAIAAAPAAPAQAEAKPAVEPVAWRYKYKFRDIGETGAYEYHSHEFACIAGLPRGEPLYTHAAPAAPAPATELSDADLQAIHDAWIQTTADNIALMRQAIAASKGEQA
jgi:hypothetical protein